VNNNGIRVKNRAVRRPPGNDLILGNLPGRNRSLGFPREARDKHLYICGGTGTGKSKFLENLIRQDIANWEKSGCGMLVLDPHGSLYVNVSFCRLRHALTITSILTRVSNIRSGYIRRDFKSAR
jgi:DNA helicase HerA-like ATPase